MAPGVTTCLVFFAPQVNILGVSLRSRLSALTSSKSITASKECREQQVHCNVFLAATSMCSHLELPQGLCYSLQGVSTLGNLRLDWDWGISVGKVC